MADNLERVNIPITADLYVIYSKFKGQIYASIRFCKVYKKDGFVYPTTDGITMPKNQFIKILTDSEIIQNHIFNFITNGEEFSLQMGASISVSSCSSYDSGKSDLVITIKNDKSFKCVNLTNFQFEEVIHKRDFLLYKLDLEFHEENIDKLNSMEKSFLFVCAFMVREYAKENVRCIACSNGILDEAQHDCKMLDGEARIINHLPAAIKKLCVHRALVRRLVILFCQNNNIDIDESFLSSLIKSNLENDKKASRIFDFTLKCLKGFYKEDLKKVKHMIDSD